MAPSDDLVLVAVQAVSRKGYDGFCRGGYRWPSDSRRYALVTREFAKLLAAERMLSVVAGDLAAPPDGVEPELLEQKRVNDIDLAGRALDEARELDRQLAIEQAMAENDRKREQLEKLRAKRGEAEAKAKSKREASAS